VKLQTVLTTYDDFEMLAGTFFDEEELGELRYADDKEYKLRLTVERIDDTD
jgi:hypothetical protein